MTEVDYSQWFHDQLAASANGFAWGARLVPSARWEAVPPQGLGEWPAACHVFHMWYYEQHIALPSMRQWLGGPLPSLDGYDEDVGWNAESHDVEPLLAAFQQVRGEQIALLPQFGPGAWLEPRECVWGAVPLLWVVSKTYQHTAEHTNDVMRIALFWDPFEARQRS